MQHRKSLYLTLLVTLSIAACGPTATDRKNLQQGFTNYSDRQFAAASSAADAYLKKNPSASNADEAYYLRAVAHLGQNNQQAAAADFRTAIAKSKRNDLKEKSYRALGNIAYDANHWSEALDDYKKSVSFSTDKQSDARMSYHIGACLQAQGEWDQAIPYFQRVAYLNTDPEWTQWAVARVDANHYALQFAAFSEPAKAADMIRQLKAAGIPATAASQLRNGKLLYLVRSGNYPQWEAADAARSRLLAKYPAVTVVP